MAGCGSQVRFSGGESLLCMHRVKEKMKESDRQASGLGRVTPSMFAVGQRRRSKAKRETSCAAEEAECGVALI